MVLSINHNEFKGKGPGVTIGRSGNIGEPLYIEKKLVATQHNIVCKRIS
jgi:hypothetical protein